MGFYGNITNTSNTTFSFDRIYPNRLVMDANVNNDGIFIGRYVLVEYQKKAAYPVAYHPTLVNGSNDQYYFYSSINKEDISKIKYLRRTENETDRLPSEVDVNAVYKDGFYKDEILQYYQYAEDKKDWIFSGEFYQCVGETPIYDKDNKYIGGYAIFKKIDTPEMKSDYIQNFEIDENHYGQGSKGFKGYDSTVWVKSSTEQDGRLIAKYVNIADLNSVVPTFDIAADAPTMTPITPHFDADSTNVYYKLHMQSPYGFRIAASEGQSDEDIVWTTTTYDKTTDTITTETTEPFAGDIYYNKAGFNPAIASKVEDNNYIKLAPTAKSGAIYSHGKEENDIQEFRLHLPAIGNMMSDAWDIIHGPKRDDARTDINGSLQGRLDSFTDMYVNAIPVKRANDGTLVASYINGNNNKTVGTNKILTENLSTSFDQDDAWIRTEINTTDLDNETKLSGISIHHTWHKQEDTTSTINKNINGVSSSNTSDKIDLYTPIVDKAGHIVGKNTETVTLPYGFKTIATNGRGTSTAENASSTPSKSNIVAENTQDTLNINSGNKWIRMDTNATNDTLTIAHDIHSTSSTTSTKSLVSETAVTTFDVPTYSFDKAGHYVSHDTKTLTVPFGYGKITGDSGSTSATATFDTLEIKTDDAWIATTVSEDKVNITHTGPVTGTPVTVANVEPEFGETFNITDWQYDSKGHKYGSTTHTVKMPDGSYTPANTATTHTDIITSLGFTPRTGAITSTKANTDTLTLYNYSANSGSLDIKATDTINTGLEKIQNHINGLRMSSTSTTDFITEITQTDGKVAVKRAKAGTLVLGTQSTDKTVSADDSLNSAINKLEARIKAEEENRKAAIDTLYGDNAENIADTFDTIKEIADFLEQDDNGTQSGIEKIISNINANTDAIEAEELRATQAETALSTDITEEETRAKAAENTLTTNLNNEISRAKGAENTLTTNLSNEVTRATNTENTLNTRITNLVGNTAVSTQIDNKISTFDSTLGTAAKVDIEAYETRIATLEATVLSLEQRLTALEAANTSPPATE